ncbi:MAG TPA: ABC transporter permease [Anaerolineales bacterium]|nr:ABC transporter permease [Anaerolineales bacterium]
MKPTHPTPAWLASLTDRLYRKPRLLLTLLLAPPLLWMAVVYLGSLLMLLLQGFFRLDEYSGQVVREFTLETYAKLFTTANLLVILRTSAVAAVVTLLSVVLAFPLAFYMAMRVPARMRTWLYLAVVLPLWSSYLVRVYAWRLILAKEGIISFILAKLGLSGALEWALGLPLIGGPSLSFSVLGMIVVFTYVWLPYMILPIQAALERVPRSLLEASEDLGASPRRTFWHVTLPLVIPGVVAGSIFTFSLTLGDFIVPSVLGNSSPFIGMAVLSHQGTSGNIPLAAAFTMVPIVIMSIYLLLARRAGAFEAL